MVAFNPETNLAQETGANRLAFTHEVSQPMGDESGKTARAGKAKAFEQLAEFGAEQQHDWLKEDIFRHAEPVREKFQRDMDAQLASLEDDNVPQQLAPDTTSEASKKDVMTSPYNYSRTSGGGMPDEAKTDLKADLSAWHGASKADKVRPAHYYAQLDMMAQQYRQQWPGEREFIDEQFNKFSGREIANRRLMATMQRINELQTGQSSERQKGLAWFEKDEAQGALGEHWESARNEYINSNGNPAVLFKWQAVAQRVIGPAKKAEYERMMIARDEANDKQLSSRATKAVREEALSDFRAKLVNSEHGAETDISKVVDAVEAGVKPDPEKVAQIVMKTRQLEQAALNQLEKRLNMPLDPTNPGRGTYGSIIEKGDLKSLYDDMHAMAETRIKALGPNADKIDAFAYNSVMDKARSDTMWHEYAMKHPEALLMVSQGAREMPKDWQDKFFPAVLTNFKLNTKEMALEAHDISVAAVSKSKDGENTLGEFMSDLNKDPTKGKVIVDGLTTASALAESPLKTPADKIAFNKFVDNLIDPKSNLAFHKYANGKFDPFTGKLNPGAEDLIDRLFSPKIMENAWKEGRGPEVERAAKNYLMGGPFAKAANQLVDLPPGLRVHWDDENKTIHVLPDMKSQPLSPEEAGAAMETPELGGSKAPQIEVPSWVKDAERTINKSTEILQRLAQHSDPSRIDEYIVEGLKQTGVDLSNAQFDQSSGLNQFVSAFRAGRKAKQQAEQQGAIGMSESGSAAFPVPLGVP